MARTLIPVDSVSNEGISLVIDTAGDSVNQHAFVNTGKEVLFSKNDDTVDHTITVQYKEDEYGRDGSDIVTVAAGDTVCIGNFNKELYNHGNEVYVDLDADTGISLCVIRL